jgi:hypothetical protein
MAQKINYNLELLMKLCSDNTITLLKDYSGELVNRDIRIKGKCLTHDCVNIFDKTFRNLYKINGYCKECTKNIRKEKVKATCLKNHGVENPFQSKEIKEKMKTTWLEKYGVENPFQSQEIKEKMKTTWLEKYGVENPRQSYEVKEKSKATCLKNLGVESPLQNKEVMKKVKETCLKNLGVENPSQSDTIKQQKRETCVKNLGVEYPSQSQEVKEQMKATCLKNLGVEYPGQSQEVKEKSKATCLKNFGVEYSLQSQEVKEKGKETCLKKYNVKHHTQNAEVAEKMSKASYSRKDYILPSGKIIHVQGYEHYALDELVKVFNEEEIITGSGSVPEIWYDDDEGNKHRHFVDIFISSQNKCIEVKSSWTAEKKNDNIFKKQKAGKRLGYNYEIWIYNSKGVKVECIL